MQRNGTIPGQRVSFKVLLGVLLHTFVHGVNSSIFKYLCSGFYFEIATFYLHYHVSSSSIDSQPYFYSHLTYLIRDVRK